MVHAFSENVKGMVLLSEKLREKKKTFCSYGLSQARVKPSNGMIRATVAFVLGKMEANEGVSRFCSLFGPSVFLSYNKRQPGVAGRSPIQRAAIPLSIYYFVDTADLMAWLKQGVTKRSQTFFFFFCSSGFILSFNQT